MKPTAGLAPSLRDKLLSALSRMGPFSRYATLNIPKGSSNIGSHLLWLAEWLYFRREHQSRLIYASSVGDYSAGRLRAVPLDAPIVLRSGYLGDHWDRSSGARRPLFESIVRDFGDRHIVVMPQSLDYQDPGKAARASEIFAGHPDVLFFARDEQSLGKVKRLFHRCRPVLSPDMVFYLTDELRSMPKATLSDSILFLRRSDWQDEIAGNPDQFGLSGLIVHEWRVEAEKEEMEQFHHWWREYPEAEAGGDYTQALRQAWEYAFLAVSQLTRHRLVITNRLHGHILCTILDIPHILVPGPYGKMTAFRETWTSDLANCKYVDRLEEIEEAASQLLAQ